jgi:hypothetical protein
MSIGPAAAAVIGAGGALLGGVLAAGSNIWLESARAKRGLDLDNRRAEMELRRAARLVADELTHSVAVIAMAEGEGHWDEASRKELKYNRWVAHQQALADHLPDEDWLAVTGAYELLYLIYRATDFGDYEPSSDEYRKVKFVVGKALVALKTYARGYSGTITRADAME